MNFTGLFKCDLYLSLMNDSTLAGISVTYTCPTCTHGIFIKSATSIVTQSRAATSFVQTMWF